MSGLRTVAILLLAVSIGSLSLNADESSGEPFVTLLAAEYVHGGIRINFEPVPDNSRYRIYRSESPITRKTDIASATLVAEIGPGELPFTDTPEEGSYYYMVSVIQGETEYFLFIPYQNMTLSPIDFSPIPQPVEAVNVRNDGSTVVVQYTPVRADYAYRLYVRGQRVSDLSGISFRYEMSGDEKGFRVTLPKNQTSYIYVTTVNRLGVENKTVLPGINEAAWTPPVKKASRKPLAPSARPFIDRNLRNNFYRGKYRTALSVFRSIEKNRRPSTREIAEIHFYSAQCIFYLDDYHGALKLFIQSKEEGVDSDMCDAWIDRCLDLMD